MLKTSVAVIEDDTLILEGLKEFFNKSEAIELVCACTSVEMYFESENEDVLVDVLLLDINLPGISGLEAIETIKAKRPDLVIIMLTIHQDAERVFQAFKNGADGYLLKNTPLKKIEEGILDVKNDGAPMSPAIAKKVIQYFQPKRKFTFKKKKKTVLTHREKEVVEQLVEGLTYQQVADVMAVSIETIRHHIKNIYSKLNVNSKSQVVSKSLKGEI